LFMTCIAFKGAKHTFKLSCKVIHNLKHILNYVRASQIRIFKCWVPELLFFFSHRLLEQIFNHVLHVNTFIHLNPLCYYSCFPCTCCPFFIKIILGSLPFLDPKFRVLTKLDQMISYLFY
jgi:hypothetical protein